MARLSRALLAAVLCAAAPGMPPAHAQALAVPAAPASAAVSPSLPRVLPLRRDEPAATPSSSGLIAGAFLLALLAAAGLLVLRRRPAGAPRRWPLARPGGGSIARVSSQALTPHASLHAVRWSDEEILLACTAQQVTIVGRKPLPPAPGDGA